MKEGIEIEDTEEKQTYDSDTVAYGTLPPPLLCIHHLYLYCLFLFTLF